MKTLKDNLKYLKMRDINAVGIFILILMPALLYRLYLQFVKQRVYLICDNRDTACDNGYHLFKYIRINFPKDRAYYAIDKRSNQYEKVKNLGNIVQFGGFKHWLYYLAATWNISSQKSGNPSAPLFYVLHVKLGLFNNRIFLQHGITKNDSPWLHYANTKFKTIICAANPEYKYIKNEFGYPNRAVQLLGFPRFDRLTAKDTNKKQIVIMPTWRNWIGRATNSLTKDDNFLETEYFKVYDSLLNNQKLCAFLKKEDIQLIFFPHYAMQRFAKKFTKCTGNVKILTNNDVDVQSLLNTSAIMVTDYSSVAMDFAYLEKPVIYYQFDKERFEKEQLPEGYFSYKDDGFGPVLYAEDDVVEEIIRSYSRKFKIEDKYKQRVSSFFAYEDNSNCRRIYDYIKGL